MAGRGVFPIQGGRAEMSTPWPPDVTLEGAHATLVPLTSDHAEALAEAVKDGELWTLWYTSVPTPEEMAAAIAERLEWRAHGGWSPFAVIERATGEPVGMTNYMRIDSKAPRVEIGGTWSRRRAQRTPLNTECKLMLLTHAFETLDCISVEFRTNVLTHQSRRAGEWRALYLFNFDPALPADYEIYNWATSTQPHSLFVNLLIAERLTGTSRY